MKNFPHLPESLTHNPTNVGHHENLSFCIFIALFQMNFLKYKIDKKKWNKKKNFNSNMLSWAISIHQQLLAFNQYANLLPVTWGHQNAANLFQMQHLPCKCFTLSSSTIPSVMFGTEKKKKKIFFETSNSGTKCIFKSNWFILHKS